MSRDMDILTSMRGIGKKTAMNFLIEVGRDVKEFESHKKVIAMAGLDPALYQSGKIDRKGKITKRGNRHLRRVIWVMTTKVIQFNARFKKAKAGRATLQNGCAGDCPQAHQDNVCYVDQ
jgi:transposase